MKKILFVLGSFIFLMASCNYNTSNQTRLNPIGEAADKPPFPTKPGACYAKCLTSSEYVNDSIEYIVYTGNIEEETSVEIEKVSVVLKPAHTKWEKRPGDRNCMSKDPNDCLVWCLVDVPEEKLEYTTLKDTTTSKNFDIKYYTQQKKVKVGGYTEWKEVLCGNKITSYTIQQIQKALRSRGYDPGPNSNILGSRTKSALSKFQQDNGLPVGQLDFESLTALGMQF